MTIDDVIQVTGVLREISSVICYVRLVTLTTMPRMRSRRSMLFGFLALPTPCKGCRLLSTSSLCHVVECVHLATPITSHSTFIIGTRRHNYDSCRNNFLSEFYYLGIRESQLSTTPAFMNASDNFGVALVGSHSLYIF